MEKWVLFKILYPFEKAELIRLILELDINLRHSFKFISITVGSFNVTFCRNRLEVAYYGKSKKGR